MKRMTLLTALALVFSLFTVTAAIAGPGPGAGDGEQAGEPAMTQTAAQVQTRVGECQTDECQTSEMTQTQTQAQTQAQTQEKEQVGECQAGDDCPAGDQAKTQTRTQTEAQLKECQADDCQGEEALMERVQTRERVMNQLLAMLGAENAEVEGQYRLILNLMLQNMIRFGAMFI